MRQLKTIAKTVPCSRSELWGLKFDVRKIAKKKLVNFWVPSWFGVSLDPLEAVGELATSFCSSRGDFSRSSHIH